MAEIGILGGKEEDIKSLAALYKLDSMFQITDYEREKPRILLVQEPHKLTERIRGAIGQDCFMLINADRGLPYLGAFGQVITYGFNSRASVTASSVNDNTLQVCVQRKFYSLNQRAYEPQEFSAPYFYNCDPTMALGAAAALMVCDLLPGQV